MAACAKVMMGVALGLSVALSALAQTVREERRVASIEAVQFEAAGSLAIRQGSTESLLIEAEPHIVAGIVAEMRGGVLDLRFKPGAYSTRFPIRLTLAVKTLSRVVNHGSGSVTVDALDTPALRLEVSGSSDVRIGKLATERLLARTSGASSVVIVQGRAHSQDIEVSGVGSFDAVGFATSQTRIVVTGTGDATVWAREQLDIEVSGTGSVRYRGEPSIKHRASGGGEITPIEARPPRPVRKD